MKSFASSTILASIWKLYLNQFSKSFWAQSSKWHQFYLNLKWTQYSDFWYKPGNKVQIHSWWSLFWEISASSSISIYELSSPPVKYGAAISQSWGQTPSARGSSLHNHLRCIVMNTFKHQRSSKSPKKYFQANLVSPPAPEALGIALTGGHWKRSAVIIDCGDNDDDYW